VPDHASDPGAVALPPDAEIRHPVFARVYAHFSRGAEARRLGPFRAQLLGGVRGRVLEVGAGNGLNFRHYPAEVEAVTALEPEPHLRALATRAAATAPVPVTVAAGRAERLPFGNGEFDAVVVSLVLCSIGDPGRALAEAHRVLRPGGELRYWEHVVADAALPALGQRMLDATLWPRVAGGCHMARDTGALIRAGGFTIARERRDLVQGLPHLLGLATRT
jgi:ubiquinone/menaquinone biosynthesis C-methylase UbiE